MKSSLTQTGNRIAKGIRTTENIFKYVALVLIFMLMTLGTVDVISRYLFNSPITGGVEYSRMMLMMIVVLGWAYAQATKSHVSVDFLVTHFPRRTQAIIDFITTILALGLFVLITWQSIMVSITYLQQHRLIAIIHFPVGIMNLVVSVGAFLICLELIIQIVGLFQEMVKRKADLEIKG